MITTILLFRIIKFLLGRKCFEKLVRLHKKMKNNCEKQKKNKKTVNCIDNLKRQDYNKYIINEVIEIKVEEEIPMG